MAKLGVPEVSVRNRVCFLHFNHLDEHSYVYNASNLTENSVHVVEYIAGFIVFKLNNILKCQDCLSVLLGNFKKKSLIGYKSRGYLQTSSENVVKICQVVESEIEPSNIYLRLKIFQC